MTKSPITQEILITKFRNSDLSEVFELDKKSDQILWTLRKIKKDFKIEEFIPVSVLTSILVEALGISVTYKIIPNALNPIKNKIHSKIIEDEMSYKIMQEGISYIEKLSQPQKQIKKISLGKQVQ